MTKSVKNLLQESSLSRVWSHMQKHDSGTITAFRSARDCNQGEVFTRKENISRNTSLKAKLQNLGYGITIVKGSYIEGYGTPDAKEVGEQVFFVVDLKDKGTLQKDLRSLGEEFEQDSILFIPKGGRSGSLIGTNRCESGYPGYGKKIALKNPVFGETGQFMTRVNGRPFILKEDIREVAQPSGFFGKWGVELAANKPWEQL